MATHRRKRVKILHAEGLVTAQVRVGMEISLRKMNVDGSSGFSVGAEAPNRAISEIQRPSRPRGRSLSGPGGAASPYAKPGCDCL